MASIGLSQRDLLETRELPGGFCGVLLFFQQPRLVARSLHGLASPAPRLLTGHPLGKGTVAGAVTAPHGCTATVTVHSPNPPPMRGPCAGDQPHPSSSPPNTLWGSSSLPGSLPTSSPACHPSVPSASPKPPVLPWGRLGTSGPAPLLSFRTDASSSHVSEASGSPAGMRQEHVTDSGRPQHHTH